MRPGRIGQAVTASVETPATAVRIRSATALGCDNATECKAPAASAGYQLRLPYSPRPLASWS